MARDPYAPPPMLPRQWLPLNPGTIVGTPANFPAPNPMGVNWPKAQFANPAFVGSTVRLMPQKPVRPSERVGAGPMHWSWSQFGNGKQNLPRFAPNPEQKPPVVLYSGPETDLGAPSAAKALGFGLVGGVLLIPLVSISVIAGLAYLAVRRFQAR